MDCPQCNLNNSPQASTCVRCGADLQSKNSRSSPVMSFRPIGSTASQTPPSRSGSAYHPRQDAQSSYKPGQSAYGSNQGYQPQDYRTPANPANYAGQGSTYGQSNPAQNTWSQPTYQSPASYNQPNAPYYGAGQAAGFINCPSCASLLPAGTQVCFKLWGSHGNGWDDQRQRQNHRLDHLHSVGSHWRASFLCWQHWQRCFVPLYWRAAWIWRDH